MLQTITENELIKVQTWTYGGKDNNGHFALEVINKMNYSVCVHYDEPFFNDNYDPLEINPNDSTIIKDDLAVAWATAFEKDWFYITDNLEEDEAALFRSDLEDIQSEIDRILNEYEFKKKVHDEQVYNSNRLITVLEILKRIK